jgi:hypothetical protein
MGMYGSALLSIVVTAALLARPAALACHICQETGNDSMDKSVVLTDEPSQDQTQVDPSLVNLRVSLYIDRKQSDLSRGLHALAVFQNRGEETVSLRGLHDTTRLEVLTADGWPVKYPIAAPDSLIHMVKPPGQANQGGVVQIKPGEEYKLPLEVTAIFPVQTAPTKAEESSKAAGDKAGTSTPISIPAGEYKVRLRTLLLPNSKYARGPRSLVSKFVAIWLGK